MQQSSQYTTCLYGHEVWATQSLHGYVDIDFRFKRSTSGTGNSYIASCGEQAAVMLDLPQQTYRTTDLLSAHAQSYDDVISGMYNEAVQSGAVIARRNERERNRVKTINQTFARLRQHLPSSAAASVVKPATQHGLGGASTITKAKKLSKVQILRAAIHYIGQLQQLLMTSDDDVDSPSDAGCTAQYIAVSNSSSTSTSSGNSVTVGSLEDDHNHNDYNRCSADDVKCKLLS